MRVAASLLVRVTATEIPTEAKPNSLLKVEGHCQIL
jgi:hypothetical protein